MKTPYEENYQIAKVAITSNTKVVLD